MSRGKVSTIRKPISQDAMRAFAEKGQGNRSGLVPVGDTRLTANIRADLHTKLKIRAAEERTTVGELIEQWIASWKTAGK